LEIAMDPLLSSQPMEDPSPERGVRRLPLRGVGRGGVAVATHGATVNELDAQTVAPIVQPRLIRFPAVQERVGMGRTAVYELIKAGKFPRPVKVGAASAWIDAEITRWIEELAARRDAVDGTDRRRVHLPRT
jgi:prophage regulatory protein